MKIGQCRICHFVQELTFEHVPPKIAYNRSIRYKSIPFIDYVKSKDLSTINYQSKINQGGIGFYSLCKKCNTHLGLTYVGAYHQFIKVLGYIAKRNSNDYFLVDIKEMELLKVLKQICSMFLSINDEQFATSNKELCDFVKDPNSQALSEKYRFFIYLNTEGNFRHLPITVTGNFHSQLSIVSSEIAFPPLGIVMTIDYPGSVVGLTEITWFKYQAINSKSKIEIELYRRCTYSPFPLDYRDKETIESAMRNR